jgi:N-methylhydantoinase B
VPVRSGDVVVIEAPSGGGYGNPLERDHELVLADVLDRIVTIDAAGREYGVVIRPDTLTVDVDATDRRRAQMRKEFERRFAETPVIVRARYSLGCCT